MRYSAILFAFMLFSCSNGDSKKSSKVSLHVMQDVVNGVNLKLQVSDFSFTPENVNQVNVSNEGHAHLFIDGVKHGRVYGEWFYVGDLELGPHEFVVKLSQNDHSDHLENGIAIQSGQTFDVMEGTMSHSHKSEHFRYKEGTLATGISATNTTLVVHAMEDIMAGYNLKIITTGFRFTPENVNGENVAGQGHAHLYIDGVKFTRLYSNWYHLKPLPAGDHEIKVLLSNNDHSNMTFDNGVLISSVVTLTSTSTTSTNSHGH